MAARSGVTLGDLDDFISPSQACVKPIRADPKRSTARIQLEDDPGAPAPGQAVAQISLSDCLACSGCVTSAETVLITAQSAGELRARLEARDHDVVVTVSPAARASLAAHYGVDPATAQLRLRSALRRLGCAEVLDCGAAADLSLCEAAAEFVAHLRASGAPHRAPGPRQPLLCAACPGVVCFLEKQHGWLLPRLSAVRSPQQVMGALVRRWLEPRAPRPVYHAAVMPCFDKKLEAARADFAGPGPEPGRPGRRDVDCVLSTQEVAELLEAQGLSLGDDPGLGEEGVSEEAWPGTGPAAAALNNLDPAQGAFRAPPGGSGGWAEFLFRVAAQEVFGRPLGEEAVPWVQGRNADWREATLPGPDGAPALRVAVTHGFRNIQNVVRRAKAGTLPYDYVELMACPGGCLNGGGQARVQGGDVRAGRARLEAVKEAHRGDAGGAVLGWPDPAGDARLRAFYGPGGLFQGGPLSPAARALLHTQYHAVQDEEMAGPAVATPALAVNW